MEMMTVDLYRRGNASVPDAFQASLGIAVKRGYSRVDELPAAIQKYALAGGSYMELGNDPKHGFGRPGPIFVSPEVPEMTGAYSLQILPSTALLPYTDKNYYGEEDAVVMPNDSAVVARTLGVKLDKLPDATMKRLSSDGATRFWYSARTRQPWLQPVFLDRTALPTYTLGVSNRAGSIVALVESMVNILPEPTPLTARLEPTIDSISKLAMLK
jgi:hypothetical protein